MTRVAVLLLFAASSCLGAVAHVKSGNTFNNSASGGSLTLSYTPSAANDVLIASCLYGGTGQTLTISVGGVNWTAAGSLQSQSGSGVAQAFWALSTGTTAISINCKASTSTANFMSLLVDEFSGASTTAPIDNHNEAGATSGSITTTIMPVANNCAIYAAAWDTLTAVGSGFTKGADDTSQDWSEYKVLSGGAGVAQTANFTGSGTWQLVVLTIAPPQSASHNAIPVVL